METTKNNKKNTNNRYLWFTMADPTSSSSSENKPEIVTAMGGWWISDGHNVLTARLGHGWEKNAVGAPHALVVRYDNQDGVPTEAAYRTALEIDARQWADMQETEKFLKETKCENIEYLINALARIKENYNDPRRAYSCYWEFWEMAARVCGKCEKPLEDGYGVAGCPGCALSVFAERVFSDRRP